MEQAGLSRPLYLSLYTAKTQYGVTTRLTYAEVRLEYLKRWWAIWLPWRSDDDDVVHPKPSSAKRRGQPMEEHRPKKLLDQVCTCPQ
jgi:hypothetical protein